MTRQAEAFKSKGNKFFNEEEFEKARRCYMEALAAAREEGADDIMHTIYGNLAHTHNKLGTYKDSEKYARLAIRKKPDWFKGYHRAALAAKNLGKLDDAISLLDKGIDNCVSNEELKAFRETLLEQKKKPKGAGKPPPPPPLLKADQQAAAPRPTAKAKSTKASKASKTSKSSSATAAPTSATVTEDQGVWSSLLATSKPAEVVSEQTAAAARAGHPDALNEELCITVRRGSLALRRPGGARQAYDEYRRALQLVAKHPKELNRSGTELISLRYCYAMACHEVATLDALLSAEEELLAIIHKTKRPMPAAFYLLGLVYMRLNRFEQASAVLQMACDVLSKDARGDTHVFPGTSEVIPDTERAWRGTLLQPVQQLLRQCQYPPRADALCRLDDCLSRITVPNVKNAKQTHQQTRRAIYYRDVDFAGFMKVQCLSKCRLDFHLACWRQLKERFGSETQRTTDKDLLNTPCPTPDCDSSICRVVTVDANGLEKHEISSDEYKRQQQKQPQKQLSKQQKKQAAQAQKKHQLVKGRKHKDSLPQPGDDGETQRQSAEPAAAAGGTGAGDAAGGAAAAPEPAPPPDLREMTVLRRGSAAEEVPVAKKSKKKKKGPSNRRRPAAEVFWQPQEDEVYNGPPVNVIYNTSQDDLAGRLCQLQELRTLQFSTRSLIPDSSVQPASVPRNDQSDEEAHAILESAYQFLYEYLKDHGPTAVDDAGLLSIASELPSHCQELIAQYGSLESFLLRLPRFYQVDDLLCVEVDVGVAEAMVGSAVSELLDATDELLMYGHPPQGLPPHEQLAPDGGVSDADTAELEPGEPSDAESGDQSDPETGQVDVDNDSAAANGAGRDNAAAGEPENGTVDEEVVPDFDDADPNSGDVDPDSGEVDPDSGDVDPDSGDVDPDSGDVDPDSGDLDPDSGDVDPDSGDVDPDSLGVDAEDDEVPELEEDGQEPAETSLGSHAEEVSEEAAVRADLSPDTSRGDNGAQGDGAWNADPELSDADMEDALSESDTSEPVTPSKTIAQLNVQVETLSNEKAAQADQLAEAKMSQLRLERTVRQLTQRLGQRSVAVESETQQAAEQQLVDTKQQLAETQGRLTQAQQQLAETEQRRLGAARQQAVAEQLCGQLQQQLSSFQQQLMVAQQQRGQLEMQLSEQQQQLVMIQQEREQFRLQLAESHQQLLDTQQHVAVLEQQTEELTNQLAAQPAAADQQLQQQLEAETSGRQRAEAALEERRGAERRMRGQYVTMLSKAGNAQLDAAARRCSDAIISAQRLADGSGRPDSARPTVAMLQEAVAALERTRTQFKETIKKACKAISSKETVDLQSLKLPEIPDIVETALNGPGSRPSRAAAASPAGSGSARVTASPRPSSRPSSAVTVSSGSGSEVGQVSASPPSAAISSSAAIRRPSPRRALTPAALQLSAAAGAASRQQPAASTFNVLVEAIERQCGASANREAVLQQLSAYRSRRGGTLRGVPRDQIVTEVTAMIRAATAAPATTAAPAAAAARTANGVAPTGQPTLLSTVPSKEECVMCGESYSTNQSYQLQCGHQFHELCLRRWLRTSGVVATCPICRHPFTSDVEFPSL